MFTWHTWTEIYRDFEKNSQKWVKQYAYERGIVKSVPPMHETVSVVEVAADDRCDPG